LALKVTVNNGIINASFHSNNAEVRGILENSIHQLKQDLANVGLKVDNVSISAGLSQFTPGQDRALEWQPPQKGSGKSGGNSYGETIDGIASNSSPVNASTGEGVDYLI